MRYTGTQHLRDANNMLISDAAQKFLTYDYAETKDLCKQFLTLVSGILVFSVTFGEKIVSFREAGARGRRPLFAAWSLFIIAIISCGLGLTILAIAGGEAAYGQSSSAFYDTAQKAYLWVIAAGLAFIFGLICLVWAAASSLFVNHQQ